nr:beta-1,4-galactosyltransferase 1-like [Mirounga angustirostris]
MRFREPLLGGSAAMPGASLQRACRLLVAVCALHLGVTLVYYLAGRDLSRLPQLVGVPTPLQGGSNGAAAIEQPSGELRPRGAPPLPPLDASSELRSGSDSSPEADSHSGPGSASNLTSAPVPSTTALSLLACPEESPLLGKDSGTFPNFLGGVPWTFARALFQDIQPPGSGSPSLIPDRGSGLDGVRGWEASPFGFTLKTGVGVVQGSRGPLWPQGPRTGEGLVDFPALAHASRSFGV